MVHVEYRVLGSQVVVVDGVAHRLGQRRERNLLALLTVARGRLVSADRLIDQLWAGEPPARAATSLQVAISRIRQLSDPHRRAGAPPTNLISLPGGYALRAADDAVDAWRFETDARSALQTSPVECATRSESLLAAWQEPYADCSDTAAVQAEIDRLGELRLSLVEARAAALLALGRADAVVHELRPQVDDYPYRERLWSLLALGQYHALRQADALGTLRRLRDRLADELGVDPSPEVSALEHAILNQTVDPPPVSAPPVSARAVVADLSVEPVALELVGREAAVSALAAAIDRLVAGRGGSVLISGDAGIGKTRLSAAATELARGRGVTTLIGRCHDADVAPAYWPWLPILRALARDDTPAEVRALLSATGGVDADPGASALRTFDAVARLLSETARREPLLIVLEDLHWADPSSLRLLGYLVESMAAPLLLVATRRTSDVATSAALTAALATLARTGAERIRLDGLATAEVGRLLSQHVGDPLPGLAEAVTERTDGNPFFVLEFARLLSAQGVTAPDQVAQIAVPDGIADVLRLRLQRLPPSVRDVLGVAAVAGRSLDPQLVAAAAGIPRATALDALDAAVGAGLLSVDGRNYQFVHALVRETLYDDLPAGRRSAVHGAVGRALEPRLRTDPELRAEVAHHFWLAAPLDPELAARAVTQLTEAARMADARNAFEESIGLWQQARTALELSDDADPIATYRLLAAQALAEIRLGDVAAAGDHVLEAVDQARAVDRWDLVAEVATSLTNAGSWSWREFGTTDQTMIAALEETLVHLPDGPLAALVLASMQMEYYYARRVSAGDAAGRRSVIMARRAADATVLLRVLLVRTMAIRGPGTHHERVALAEEMLALQPVGESEVNALWQYGVALLHAGRSEDADHVLQRCRDAATRLRHTSADVPIAWWQFMQAVARDDPGRRAVGDAALALHRRSTMVALADLTGLHTIRSAEPGTPVPPDVVAAARESPIPGYRALVAYALVEAGDLDEAGHVLGSDGPADASDYGALASDCLRAAVYAAIDRPAEARTMLRRITKWTGEVVTYGSVDHLGAVDFFIAAALADLGEPGPASTHAAAAVTSCERIGNLPWLRRAQRLLARLSIAPTAG